MTWTAEHHYFGPYALRNLAPALRSKLAKKHYGFFREELVVDSPQSDVTIILHGVDKAVGQLVGRQLVHVVLGAFNYLIQNPVHGLIQRRR
jgi:hypothetical protein